MGSLRNVLVVWGVLLAAAAWVGPALAQSTDPEAGDEGSAEGVEGEATETEPAAETATEGAPDEAAAEVEAEASASTGLSVSPNAQKVDEPAPEAPKPLPWRNSIFSWDHALGVNTIAPGETLSANPYYAWFLTLRPRWYLSDTVFLAVGQTLQLELTDTDSRARNREPVLFDTLVDLIWNNALAIPVGDSKLGVSPGLRVVLPTSIASRAQEMYFGVGPTVATRISFDVAEGLLLGGNAQWRHHFQGTNVTTTETSYPCFTLDAAQQRCSSTGGPSSDSDAVIATVLASLSPIADMTLDMSFTWWWRFGHELQTAKVPVQGAPNGYVEVEDTSDTHMRLATSFSAGASYNIINWLNLAFTVNTFSSEFAQDGSRRNPFFNIYDTTLDLTATVVLDQFYTAAFGASGAGNTPTNPRNQVNNSVRPVVAF